MTASRTFPASPRSSASTANCAFRSGKRRKRRNSARGGCSCRAPRLMPGRSIEGRGRRSMAEYGTILVEQRGAVTLVTRNRPEALNALSSAVLEDLIAAFAAFEADGEQRCAVLTGAGGKAFAAGADIKEMAAKGAAD